MKKQILNFGKTLSKVEQKNIQGGQYSSKGFCYTNADCMAGHGCCGGDPELGDGVCVPYQAWCEVD